MSWKKVGAEMKMRFIKILILGFMNLRIKLFRTV